MRFEVHILGCGAALPANGLNPTSQIVNVDEKHYMIDCGEGTQTRLRAAKLGFQKVNHIFISHMHGDHVYGLPGFLCSLHLLGRTRKMTLFGPEPLQNFVEKSFLYSGTKLGFEIEYIVVDAAQSSLIFEDKSVTVTTIPLKHSAPTTGFLFREKAKPLNLMKEAVEKHNIPIAWMAKIKSGADYVDERTQEVIPNAQLTHPPKPTRSYAYCSDTAPYTAIVPIINNVDLLYHESTFLNDRIERAAKTLHSTAQQAAEIASAAGVKQLVLGHFSARYKELEAFLEEAIPVFKHTHLAAEGATFAIL